MENKKLINESLGKMKNLMDFQPGMTKTELKDKLMTQLAEEAEDVKEEDKKSDDLIDKIDDLTLTAHGHGDDEKEDDEKKEDVKECDDVKEEDVTESGDSFKLEKLQAQGQQSEDDNAITPSEDMFEQPEIQAGGPKMTQGFEDTEIPIYDMKTYFKRIMQNPKNINRFYDRLSKGTYGGKPALDAIKIAYKDYSGEDLPIKEKKLPVTPEVADNTPELEEPTDQPAEKGFKMTQGFVNESISQKERVRQNKQNRLDKKLGRA